MTRMAYQNIQERLAEIISNQPPSSRLLSEPRLAKTLGVSRATLREALRTFEEQGLISRRQGVGTFVVDQTPKLESGLEVLESIETMAARSGLSVSSEGEKIVEGLADDKIADALNIDIGTELTRVSRIIKLDDRPVAYLVDVLPRETLSASEILNDFKGSVLDFIIERGQPKLASSRTEIKAVSAPSEVANAMHIQRHDVLLHFIAYLYDISGKVVDYSLSYFLPGVFRFHIIRKV